MSALEVFTQGDTAVRTKLIDGEPCVLLGDIVNALGMKSTPAQVAQRLPEGVRRTDTLETAGGPQRATFVTEAGLYRVVMRSDSPKAEPFIEWVTGEVLPAIRATGSYSMTPAPAIPQSFAEAMELAARQARELEQAAAELAVAAPKVEAFDDLMGADGCFDMGGAARAVTREELGRTKFMAWLREERILQKVTNLPYREYDRYFRVTVGSHAEGERGTVAHRTTRVRPEGIDWLRKRYKQRSTPALVALAGGAS